MKIKENILFVLSIVAVGVPGLVEANVKVANQTNETLKIRLHCSIKTEEDEQFTIAPKTILPIIMTDGQFANCNHVEVWTDEGFWHKLTQGFKENKDDEANILVINQQ